MSVRKFLVQLCATLFLAVPASAQFYLPGVNPASVRWSYILSDNYKVIYPSGLDSLAREYALSLEKYRIPVSRSVNYIPGEYTRSRMQVILHPFSAYANGSVAWAPKRMDLFSSPEMFEPEPMPWMNMLASHESRHVAQMQFGLSHVFRPFGYVFGEMFNGLLAGLYPSKWLLEGDAVVAETGLNNSGRGRTADFLNYYRIAFDHGDYRNYDRWDYGSYKYYTPDQYAFGYMLLSGIRYVYDVPDFSGRLFRHFAKRPYDLNAKNNLSRKLLGAKNFYAAADTARLVMMDIWSKDMEERAPFLSYEDLGRMRGHYTEYTESMPVGDELYAFKESFSKGRRMVKIDFAGKEKVVTVFGSETSELSPASGKIFWSEIIRDKRWSQKYNSVIRTMDLSTGRKKNFTRPKDGRLFSPCVSPDETMISVGEYTDDARSHLVILDAETGNKLLSYDLPDTLQLVRSAWIGEKIYMTCVSCGGYGIYCLESLNCNNLELLLSPSPVKIINFAAEGDCLMFTSDRNGTDELYLMEPESRKVFKKTSLRYGAVDFSFSEDGEWLYGSLHDLKGKRLVRIPADSLLNEEVDFFQRYVYPVAEKLSEQERALASAVTDDDASVAAGPEISAPKKYRKFPNAFRVHSWAPFYSDYDRLMDFSYDYAYQLLSFGAMAFFQDNLGTLYGQVGYSAHKDPYDRSNWRHSGHLNLTYAGWYPVIEAKVDFNDRAAQETFLASYVDYEAGLTSLGLVRQQYSAPYFHADLSVYVPFNFSSGGWSRGLIPQISYNISNDVFYTGALNVDVTTDLETGEEVYTVRNLEPGKRWWNQTLGASLRYYNVLPTAHAEIYPDWGFGVEIGAACNPGVVDIYTPSGYVYAYGYLPGITGNQGFRLTATFRQQLNYGRTWIRTEGVNLMPRGLTSYSGGLALLEYPSAAKFTADYAIPFYMGDFRIWRLFYVKRGILTPHFDYTMFGRHSLWSAGATLAIEFGNFFKLSYPMSFGVTYSYNGGDGLPESFRHTVSPVFSISF